MAASLDISPWWAETPLLFTAGCYVGAFPSFGAPGWRAGLEFRLHSSQGAPPAPATEISLQNFIRHPRSPASPLAPLHFLPVLMWFLLLRSWLRGFSPAVLSWLFRMTVLLCSGSTSLVLGRRWVELPPSPLPSWTPRPYNFSPHPYQLYTHFHPPMLPNA